MCPWRALRGVIGGARGLVVAATEQQINQSAAASPPGGAGTPTADQTIGGQLHHQPNEAITAMAAQEEIGTETLELNPLVVRFVWRHATYPTGWSTRRQQLLLDDFVVAAEKEVACT